MFIKSIIYSVLACLIWGLIFLIPYLLEGINTFDIVLGRYFCYGTLSLALLLYSVVVSRQRQVFKYWKQAFLCALVMNFLYFISLVMGMRLSSPSVIALLVGISPLVIVAISGRKQQSMMRYFVPALVIVLGLNLVNIQTFLLESEALTFWEYVQGIAFGLVALVAWAWYVIFNSNFLAKNREVNPWQWTTLIGVATLCLTIVGMAVRVFTMDPDYMEELLFTSDMGIKFLVGSIILGVLCSWIAYALWNSASAKLSAALSGQIAILETVFGILFVYGFEQVFPTYLEIIGIICILLGVWRGLYISQSKAYTS
ncbi:MAG: DMT family transporter [Chlamydiales bacterium]|nr:DMT family transporter [Chlamydiales bacterium]